MGTGDYTHPGWLNELKEKLEPAEEGLYKLKNEFKKSLNFNLNNLSDKEVRFILTGEISCIYKKKDKVRKVHNVVFAPDFESVKKIQYELNKIGNIKSDGRPILGFDAKNLLDLILNVSDKCFLVPAHIWTPWFSVLGSKSGFNSIDECYEDLTEHIFAVESGLSSDPPMNRACSFLDKFSIISNSDAHSPENLGREANIFDTEFSYDAIKNALKNNKKEFLGTIEFFPQEGKYHLDGHRKCNICWDPVKSVKNNLICPVCSKKLTLGVMYRVAELADRDIKNTGSGKNQFYSLIPLKEILSEIINVNKTSKKVEEKYFALLKKLGSEFDILLNHSYQTLIEEDKILAEGIIRMREGRVFIKEGYDGEYGQIKVFNENEKEDLSTSNLFFSGDIKNDEDGIIKKELEKYSYNIDIGEFKKLNTQIRNELKFEDKKDIIDEELNSSQLKAVKQMKGPCLIIAGPGTGKTKTLTYKIIELLNNKIDPENILALTFSNQAAKEIKSRVNELIKDKEVMDQLMISTFHSFGLSIIEENLEIIGRGKNYSIINQKEKGIILKDFLNVKQDKIKKYIQDISDIKQKLKNIYKNELDVESEKIFNDFNEALIKNNLFDFDDLLNIPIKIFNENPEILKKYQDRYKWITIDEYQDINFAQYILVKMLADNKDANITVIGDPNQAIYGFRGASVTFINDFKKDFPETKIFQLEKSYRCTDNILNASSHIFAVENKESFYLKGIEEGAKIIIKEFNSDKSEAEFVAREIEKLIGGLRFFSIDSGITDGDKEELYTLSDFTVLVRINQQIEALEKAFKDHSIPYQKIGDAPFYNTEPFVFLIDLIKAVINPENIFLKNVCNKLKIEEDSIYKLKESLNTNKLSIFIKIISEKYFKEIIENYKNELDNLIEISKDFNDRPELFINYLTTSQSIDQFERKAESVKLMTMHSAKGLEFNTVFIVGCSDKLLPFTLFENYDIDIKEEERLLYVAMTRAKKYLYLTYPGSLNLFGRIIESKRSIFLGRIEKELIEFQKHDFEKKKNREDKDQLNLF